MKILACNAKLYDRQSQSPIIVEVKVLAALVLGLLKYTKMH